LKIPHLLAEPSLKAIERACLAASQILIALDYDGTLVPYADTTAGAALPEDARALLRRLCGRPHVAIALLSGRPLKEMQKLAGVREATIAALHGLELLVGGEREEHDDLLRAERIIEGALEELKGQLDAWEEVRIENKRVCLTVHHPKLTKKGADELSEKLEEILKAERVQMVRGKRSIEVLPDIAWDRGLSVRRFMEHHRKLGSFPLLICAGDDAFDAHALRMARDMSGIAIGVGREAARSGN
jgi:trehalose 6-phosphate phosphatase